MYCEICKKDIDESYPYEIINNVIYCGDCAFISECITEEEYIKRYLFWLSIKGIRAVIKDGKVEIGTGTFPWERTSRNRVCKAYTDWRLSVFERDKYTCQRCKKRGGILNAHHIKSYKDFPNLRYELSNGVTLCETCHKNLHKEMRSSK